MSALPCTPQEHPGIPNGPNGAGEGEKKGSPLSRPLPQSQRGDRGERVARVAEAAGPPRSSLPTGGTRTRAVSRLQRFSQAMPSLSRSSPLFSR